MQQLTHQSQQSEHLPQQSNYQTYVDNSALRRSARLSTRPPQLPIVTADVHNAGSLLDEMMFFDADELQQHVLQQQQQFANNNFV